MSKIFVCVPNQNWIHTSVAVSLIHMAWDPRGHHIGFNFGADKPVDSNRNSQVYQFMTSPENWEYLFFMDDDNPPWVLAEHDGKALPEGAHPFDLTALDKDILVLPTPIWNGRRPRGVAADPFLWNGFSYDSELEGWREWADKRGVCEIDAGGSGCMIVARRVFEVVKPAFIRETNEWGVQTKGSDLWFCERARQQGFKVWCAWDHVCQHYKELNLTDLYKLMDQRDIRHADRPNINTPDYWDEQWAKRPERVLSFYQEIADEVAGQHVLDYGCGRGDLLALLGPNAEGCDISQTAVKICEERGLKAWELAEDGLGTRRYDAIVCTEVLEHVDDDVALLEEFFKHTDHVIYSVPDNCMPPGMEPEHRRVYTEGTVRRITPHLRKIVHLNGVYMLVFAKKKE